MQRNPVPAPKSQRRLSLDSNSVSLHHGDFFKVVNQIPDESVDLVFADPPYFLSNGGFTVKSGKQASVNKGAWDSSQSREHAASFHQRWIGEVRRVMTKDASIVISGTHHSIFQCGIELESSGYKLLNDIIWFKPNGAPNLSRRRLGASHETLLWATVSESSRFIFNYETLKTGDFPGDKIKREGRQMRSVWWIPTTPMKEKQFGRHPTQKPLALMTRVVEAFSAPNSTVLDPFMGSGTTGLACQKLGRRFIGIEENLDYVLLAKRRMGLK